MYPYAQVKLTLGLFIKNDCPYNGTYMLKQLRHRNCHDCQDLLPMFIL